MSLPFKISLSEIRYYKYMHKHMRMKGKRQTKKNKDGFGYEGNRKSYSSNSGCTGTYSSKIANNS